ncbi:MAG: hypothetical protein RL450_930 [Actinomycetota bacterium]|jgi:DNA-binding MarR family transcriptional regulator
MSNLPIDKEFSGQSDSAPELMRKLFKANQEYSRILGGQLEVNPTDLRVMEFLMENGPATPGSIATAVGVTAGALTQSLDRLEKVGHTKREQNPADRRSIRVVPNPKSVERAWAEIRPLIQASAQVLETMKPSERDAVARFLETMLEAYRTKLEQEARD